MRHAGATTAIIATTLALTACTTASDPEEPATTAPSSEATQEPTTDTPTVTPAPQPTNEDGIDLAANYPDADTSGYITQYRAITGDETTPDEEALHGGYQLCYDMDIEGPQAIIDKGTQALMRAGAPSIEDATNISSLIAYAASKHICTWNEQYVLEIIQSQ